MAKCLTPEQLKDKAEEYTDTLAKAGIRSFPDQIKYFVDKGQKHMQQLALLAPYIKDAYKKLGIADPKAVDDFNIATHIKTVAEANSIDKQIKPERQQSQPMTAETSGWVGKVVESVFPATGEMQRAMEENRDTMTSDMQVREAGNVWLAWAKGYAPELYRKAMKLASSDRVGIQRALDRNPSLKGDALIEDVASRNIVEQKDNLIEVTPKEVAVKNINDAIFDKVKSYLKKNFKIDLEPNFQTGQLTDFAAKINSKVVADGHIDNPSKGQIENLEGNTTLTRFQVDGTVSQKNIGSFIPDIDVFTTTEDTNASANAKQSVAEVLSDRERNQPEQFIKGGNVVTEFITTALFNPERGMKLGAQEAVENAIASGSKEPYKKLKDYFYDTLKSIKDVTDNKLGTENPMHKSFTLNLLPLIDQVAKSQFDPEFQKMAERIANGEKMDIYGVDTEGKPLYSSEFRTMWSNLAKHFEQKAHLDKTGNSVVADSHRIVKDEFVKMEGEQRLTKQAENISKFIGKSQIAKKIYEWTDRNFLKYTENLDAWAKHITGVDDGLLNKLMKAITGANGSIGKEAVYKTAFDKAVQSLYESEWLTKGSHTLNPNLKLSELETHDFGGTKLTTEEVLSIFMQCQRDEKTRAAWFGSEEKPTKHTFVIDEFKGERTVPSVKIGYEDYKRMEELFDPHHDQIADTWAKASNQMATVVNPVYKIENGIELVPINEDRTIKNRGVLPGDTEVEEIPKRWGFYFPHTAARDKNIVYDKLNQNKFINEIASHKTYSPSNDVPSSAKSFFKTIQNYRDGNAKYAALAVEIRNIDNWLKLNEETMKSLGLEHKIEWWTDFKKNTFNPSGDKVLGTSALGLIGNYILSRLGMNPFVSAKQLTAIPLAVNTIPAKYLFRAKDAFFSTLSADISNYDMFTDWINRDKKNIEIFDEMNAHIPYALYRNTNGNSELQRLMQTKGGALSFDIMGKKISIDRNDLMKNIQTPDKAIGAMYYTAAKMMANEEGLFQDSKDPSKFWGRVGDLYTQAITESQHSSDDAHRSLLATKNNIVAKSLSLFGSQQIAAFNGFQSRVLDYISDPSSENLKKASIQAMNVFVTNAMMTATIETGRWMLLGSAASLAMHKPEDVYMDNFIRGVYSNVPIASPVLASVQSKYQNGVYGQNFSYPFFDIVNDGGNAIANSIHAITDGTKKKQAINDLLYSTSNLTGFPTSPLLGAKKAYEVLK